MSTHTIPGNPLEKEFIRLLTDFGFKRVFGSRQHAGILVRFLNALFEREFHVEHVEFRDKELLPEHIAGKRVLYDIYCTTDSGSHFILEMQQEESENFSDRILFYVSKAIVNQGMRGVEYELDPVYCIVIANFSLTGMSRSLLKDMLVMERTTHEVYTKTLRIMFLSLPEVCDDWDDCKSELERQLYLIKNMENMTKESKPYQIGKYEELFSASSISGLTNEEAVAYSQSYLKELDNQSAIRFAAKRTGEEARAKGREEGIKEGIKEGRKEGIKEGRKEGLAQGFAQGIRLMINRMLSNGKTIPEVSALVGYSQEEIHSLLANSDE